MTTQLTINETQFNKIQAAVAAVNPNVSIIDMTRVVEDDGTEVVYVDAADLIARKLVTFTVTSDLTVRQ